MMVLTGDPDSLVVAQDATWCDRLKARLRAGSLDRELARGVSPEAGVGLALRARILVRPRTRRHLAHSLERLLVEAIRTTPRVPPTAPVLQRGRIRQAARPIQALIDHLLRPVPVSARGVALVCVLLSDGGSPLYLGSTDDDLACRVEEALMALEPLSDWRW